MNAEPAPCGTYAAYQAHKKAGQEACQSCKDAAAGYQRTFRRTRPELYARALASQHAKERAWIRLAREYPERFNELLNEERLTVYQGESA